MEQRNSIATHENLRKYLLDQSVLHLSCEGIYNGEAVIIALNEDSIIAKDWRNGNESRIPIGRIDALSFFTHLEPKESIEKIRKSIDERKSDYIASIEFWNDAFRDEEIVDAEYISINGEFITIQCDSEVLEIRTSRLRSVIFDEGDDL